MIRRFVIAAALCPVLDAEAVDIRRVEIPSSGIVWDAPADASPAASRASWIREWSITGADASDAWIDARLAGTCVPSASVTVKTLDPDGETPRTRIDQSFTLSIELGGLLTGMEFPSSVSKVLLERRLLPAADREVESRTALISCNGLTRLRFPASALTATDPTRARGEEEFVIHTLAGDGTTPTRLGGSKLRVFPVASGSIEGIENGGVVHQLPRLVVTMRDLYPTSDNRLMLFPGSQVNGNRGLTIRTRKVRGEECVDAGFAVDDLERQVAADGTYTLALVSDTVFGRELLSEPVTFQLSRHLQASADTTPSSLTSAP